MVARAAAPAAREPNEWAERIRLVFTAWKSFRSTTPRSRNFLTGPAFI